MLTITPIKINNLLTEQITKQKQNTQKSQENSNVQLMAYPQCYYTNNIAFGVAPYPPECNELKRIFAQKRKETF